MKTITSIAILVISISLPASTLIADELPDLDESDVRDFVDIRAFEIGDDGDVSNLFYVVDRTTKNCFLIARDNYPGGLAVVDCKSLRSIPLIKTYLETGKLGKTKKNKVKKNKD